MRPGVTKAWLLALLNAALFSVADASGPLRDSLLGDYATPAEVMRSNLAEAAVELDYDPAQARQLVQQAQTAYLSGLNAALRTAAPQAATQVRASLARSLTFLGKTRQDALEFMAKNK